MKFASVIAAAALTAAGSFVTPGTAHAQGGGPATIVIFGDDRCPSNMICVRANESERYRIPPSLRGENGARLAERWGDRAKSIEYAGAGGIQSCSPVGAGGATGCYAQIARAASAERHQARQDEANSAAPH